MSVLGLNSGYTGKYSPLQVSSGFALKNSLRQRAIFDLILVILLLLAEMSPLIFQVPLPVSLEQAGQSGEWGSGGKADRADNRLEGNIWGFQAKELRAANVTRSSETAKLVQCTEVQYKLQVVKSFRPEQFCQ